MQQTAFFDPSDLITWVHPRPYLQTLTYQGSEFEHKMEEEEERALRAFYNLAESAYKLDGAATEQIHETVRNFGAPAARWLITLWHEQRHFVDHVLTNYGASKFRAAYMLRSQLSTILKAAIVNNRIAFPLSAYSDRVRLKALGISVNGEHPLAALANFMSKRRDMWDADRQAGKDLNPRIPLDGHAMLEALGSIAQLTVLFERLNYTSLQLWEKLGPSFTKFPYLLAVGECLEHAGLKIFSMQNTSSNMIIAMNDSVLSPIMIACLMCRRGNFGNDIDQTSFLPAYRLTRILDEVKYVRNRDIKNADDGYELVDKLCKKIWGKGIIDDLNEDIDFTQNQLRKFEMQMGKENQDALFMSEYIDARRETAQIFKSSPSAFCSHALYVKEVVPNFLPKLVFVDAGADGLAVISDKVWDQEKEPAQLFDGPNGKVRSLMHQTHYGSDVIDISITRIYYYDRVGIDEGRVYNVKFSDSHWVKGVLVSPHISLLTDGRKSVSARDFAIYLAEKNLRDSGISVVFDAGYQSPGINRDPSYLFDMHDAVELTCDFSGEKVTRDTSMIITSWDFYENEELQELARLYKKEGLSPLLNDDGILGDWNFWLVRKDLASFLTS
jgi:hypothetical protein